MKQDGADKSKRRFLTGAATVVGGTGLVLTAVPFINYWLPSARTKAAGAPVEVDVSKLEPGQRVSPEWRGKPVWVLRRDERMLETLPELEDQLRDPESKVASQQPPYAQNRHRSLKPEYLVLVGICTHLGCSPLFEPEPGVYGDDWLGGFFCPCHGSKFDLAGRVYQGVPAPTNLVVPPYRFADDGTVVVGEDPQDGGAA
ncbi:ubiquinol-cytochrome c reductase iron-sulfur subunit [Ectothiorhodospiraceae bacterium WFHF3C12]|nr:ubiquinol-cytochrome c reductase iron-sulfur subunit [Ectothiorhodospiraceae bacterium WFHF3C12]